MLRISDFRLPNNSLCNKILSSIVNRQSSIFRYLSSPLYICRETSTNQLLFMQNKPNFQKIQVNVSNIITRNYKNFIPLAGQKTNPIQTQTNPVLSAVEWANLIKAQMNVNLTLRKDYRKNDAFTVRINKPNFVKGPK